MGAIHSGVHTVGVPVQLFLARRVEGIEVLASRMKSVPLEE